MREEAPAGRGEGFGNHLVDDPRSFSLLALKSQLLRYRPRWRNGFWPELAA